MNKRTCGINCFKCIEIYDDLQSWNKWKRNLFSPSLALCVNSLCILKQWWPNERYEGVNSFPSEVGLKNLQVMSVEYRVFPKERKFIPQLVSSYTHIIGTTSHEFSGTLFATNAKEWYANADDEATRTSYTSVSCGYHP